jgi:hypothetical protein
MYIYKIENDTFIKLATPDISPSTAPGSMEFDNSGTYLIVSSLNQSPFVAIYKRDGDTFTKLANPETLQNIQSNFYFKPDNNEYLLQVARNSMNIFSYKRVNDTFIALNNPIISFSTGNFENFAITNDWRNLIFAQ